MYYIDGLMKNILLNLYSICVHNCKLIQISNVIIICLSNKSLILALQHELHGPIKM